MLSFSSADSRYLICPIVLDRGKVAGSCGVYGCFVGADCRYSLSSRVTYLSRMLSSSCLKRIRLMGALDGEGAGRSNPVGACLAG